MSITKRVITIVWMLSMLWACSKAQVQQESTSAEDVRQGLVIVNNLAETLSVKDSTGRMHNNVQLTGASPNAILSDPPYIYVVNSLSNSIQVLDASSLATVREISVGPGKNPMCLGLIYSKLIAVSGFLAQTLDIVDIQAGQVLKSIDLSGIPLPRDVPAIGGKAYPYAVAVANGRIFVTLANLTDHYGGLAAAGPGVVAVLDAVNYTLIKSVELAGADPMAAQPYGGRVYIACAGHYAGNIVGSEAQGFQGDGTVECLDADSLERSGTTYNLAAAPSALTISASGVLYTSNAMGGDIPRINLTTGAIDYLRLGASFISSVLAVGETLYALDFASDTLYTLDNQGAIQARATVGDGPIAMLSLSDVAAEGFVVARMNAFPSIASPGVAITFDATSSLTTGSLGACTWDFGDGQTATGALVSHAYQTPGEYQATLIITAGAAMGQAVQKLTIIAASPFATEVIAYAPAPGQFTNNPQFNNPVRALGPPVGGVSPYQPNNSSVVSLGGYGGSITLAFDHMVMDNPADLDFIVFGNAQYDQAPGRFIEPGIVEISPDGSTWYLIPGSNAQVSNANHTLPADVVDTLSEGRYALWGYADLSPVLALPQGADPLDFYTRPDDPLSIGIDSSTPGGDAFDIAWAIDPITGLPANLEGFRYIRITSAVNGSHGGSLGEISTEVDAVADVGL